MWKIDTVAARFEEVSSWGEIFSSPPHIIYASALSAEVIYTFYQSGTLKSLQSELWKSPDESMGTLHTKLQLNVTTKMLNFDLVDISASPWASEKKNRGKSM